MNKTKENNWIDLSPLPKMGGEGNKIAWGKVNNVNVHFVYEGICGTIKIIKPLPNRKSLILYNGKESEIQNESLRNCNLAYIIGVKSHDFKYQENEIVNVKEGRIKILKRYRINRNKKEAGEIRKTSEKCYDFECMICHGIIDKYTETKIEELAKCPYCSKHRLLVGFNDMWTTHPEQAKLLKNPEYGYKYMYSANKPELEWICPYCKEEIIKTPNDVATKGLCCPNCNNMNTYPNRFMYHFVKQLTNNVTREKSFFWSEGRRYDIFFDNYCICEAHGLQHYEEQISFTDRSLEEEQKNDKLKQKLALSNGIKEYRVIDCRKSDFDFIKNNVINSRFAELYNLSKVDWLKLENDINNNIFIEASELWNAGIHDPEILAEKLNIHKSNIHIIMSRAKELGLCNYDTAITQAIGREKMNKAKYQKYGKPFVCNETGDYYGSPTICVKALEEKIGIYVDRRNIERNLKTGKSPVRGLTFSYITHEQFNKIKTESPDKAYGDFFVA